MAKWCQSTHRIYVVFWFWQKISVCAKPLVFIWFGWLTLCLRKFSHFKVLKVESDFCRVALEVDQLSGSTNLLEVDLAPKSTYLCTYISHRLCTSVCQSCHIIQKRIKGLTLSHIFRLYLPSLLLGILDTALAATS